MELGRMGLWTVQLDLQPMSRAREVAHELEELGFRTVWIPDAMTREPFTNSALLLSGTEQLVVATGIVSIYGRTATTAQAAWKTLTEAFPDRFLLGLGASHQVAVENFHGAVYDKPYSTMVKYLDAMDKGVFFGAPPPVAPRRVLAALGPKMLELAAERAWGAHPYFVPVEHTSLAREVMGPDALLAPELMVVFETDPAKARETARKATTGYLGLPNYANNLRRLGWTDDDFKDGGSDKLVDGIVAWGSLDTIIGRVKAHLGAGADHVCVQVLTEDRAKLPMDTWRELASALTDL